jgi:aspartate aminotransferase-like enzyme
MDEALDWLLEEGLENRARRHALHARTFYSVIQVMGLKGVAAEDVRSNTVIAVLYPAGIDDKAFRKKLSEEHDILVGGGVGSLKGRSFRIGSMGDVSSAHVHRTTAAMAFAFNEMGHPVDLQAIGGILDRAS